MQWIWASEFGNKDLNRSLWLWASNAIFGTWKGFGPCATMGVFDGADLIAVVVYHNYCSRARVVELSAASTDKRWLTRAVLREMFARPFEAMDCQMVVLRVSPNDKALCRMLTAYGFTSYRIPRLRGQFEDEMIFTLTNDAWRTNKFNKKVIESGQVISRSA